MQFSFTIPSGINALHILNFW